jgi:signal transduction histidine kinase
MDLRRPLLRYSVVFAGGTLLALSIADLVLDGDILLVDGIERALPIAIALTIIAVGYWLPRQSVSPPEIGLIACGTVLGGFLFALIVGWILVVFRLEHTLQGELSYIFLNGSAIGMFGNTVLAYLFLELRRQNQELQHTSEQLEKRNHQLKQQTAQLRAQNDRLDTFAGIVSHDLRNPLNVAMGRLDLARSDEEDEHFQAIEQALERIDDLISGLLKLARQGQTVDEFESTSLSEVTETAWGTVATGELTLTIEQDARLRADTSRLQQVFENLFRNAVTHGGADASTVRVGVLDTGGFYIEDDGDGMPQSDQETIFSVGYTTSSAGTGYGLNIVEAIVEAHGWSIAAVEGSDGGARFEIQGVESLKPITRRTPA